MTKLAFASPEWIAMMHATLAELVEAGRGDLAGVDFTMCEIISDVPPDGGVAVLAARITDAGVTFFDTPVKGDLVVRGDYEAMLPGARLVHRTATPEDFAAQAARRKEMIAAGRLSSEGGMAGAPKALLKILGRMHDRVAERTA